MTLIENWMGGWTDGWMMDGWMDNGTHCYKHINKTSNGGYFLGFTGGDIPATLSSSRLPWGLREAVVSLPAWLFHLYAYENCLSCNVNSVHTSGSSGKTSKGRKETHSSNNLFPQSTHTHTPSPVLQSPASPCLWGFWIGEGRPAA